MKGKLFDHIQNIIVKFIDDNHRKSTPDIKSTATYMYTHMSIEPGAEDVGSNWDKLAPDEENANEYAKHYINEGPPNELNGRKQKHSTYYYLAHFGAVINKRYRENCTNKEDLEAAELVASNKTDIDLVLYRGVHDDVFDLMIENAKEMNDCNLYEKGFLATSLVKGHEINSKIKLRIKVPKGTKCVYMGDVNGEQNYYEVDVMYGSKLKIISKDAKYINCELIETA